ncbi:MAG: hypothetical protein ACON39_05750 [Coraliomargaritaceae bacterium]
METQVDYPVYCSTDLKNWEVYKAAPSVICTSSNFKKVQRRANETKSTEKQFFMRISIDPEDIQ